MSGTLLLILLALAPVAFGAVPAWAWSTLACGFALAAMAAGVETLCRPGEGDGPPPPGPWRLPAGRERWPRAFAACCFGGVLAMALAQSLPAVALAHPLWSVAADALGTPVASTVALEPAAARAGLAGLLSVLVVAALARRVGGRGRRAAMRLHATIVAAASLCAGYGLLVLAADWNTVLWVVKPAYQDVATGPFINRNAFAGYLGLALIAAAGAMTARLGDGGAVALIGPAWPWTAATSLLVAALLATQSRGGIAATAVGLLAWLAAPPAGAQAHRRGVWLALAGLALAGIAGLALDDRLADLQRHAGQRLAVYALTVDAIAERPWLGHGLGSFPAVFRMHAPADAARTFLHAHNGYLQAALALGIPATAALVAGIGGLAAACWQRARAGSGAGRAGFAAAALLASHALVDFAPQVPAVAITGAAMIGLGTALRPRRPAEEAAGPASPRGRQARPRPAPPPTHGRAPAGGRWPRQPRA